MADNEAKPLFGETRRKDKIVNAVVAVVTTVFVVVTVLLVLISCFILNHQFVANYLGYLFSVVILLQLVPQVFVVMWYRRGELEPKFRRMIYYNAVLTVLLCIAVTLYSFRVDNSFCATPGSVIPTPTTTTSLRVTAATPTHIH